MAELSYRRHIDGLRAVAVMAVVAFHAGVPWLPGGYVGVDVFFVVSGFLITGLLLREFEASGDISLVGFYERRVRRLAPALLLVLVVTLVLGAVFLVPIGGEQQGLAKSTIATLLLGSNVWFAHATGGYFDAPAAAQPLLHTWSLSVEEQFYLVWPALLLLTSRWAKRHGNDPARAAAATLALVGLASLLLSIFTTQPHPEFAFFGSPTRAWEFAIGGLAFFMIRRRSAPIPLAQPLALLGLVAIVWACATFVEGETPFPGWRAGIPALGAALVSLGGEHDECGWCTRWLTLRPMVFIGLLSYSLYLWHWPLLVVARLETLGEVGPWAIAGICLLSFLLAWLTYRHVENPLRRKRYPLMATRRSAFVVGFAGCALVMVLAGGLGVWSRVGWRGDAGKAALQMAFAEMRVSRSRCTQQRPYRGTFLSVGSCPPPAGDHTSLLLWGDSHADALVVMAEPVSRDRGEIMRIRTMEGCPPLPGYGQDGGCENFNADVLAEALRLRRRGLTTVVMEAHWPAYVKTPEALRVATTALNKTVEQLTRVGLLVVLVEPSVDQRHDVPACLARRPASQCGRPRAEVEAYRRGALDMVVQAGKAVGTQLLDPLPYLCTRDFCPVVLRGDVLYSDSNHLSVAGAMRLRPAFAQVLQKPAHTDGTTINP